MISLLEKLEKYVLLISIAILPVFVIVNTTSPAVASKGQLFMAVCSLALIFWVIRMFIKGSITFALGKFDLAVLFISIAYLLSAVFKTPNKMEAFFIPGMSSFVLISAALYFLINQLGKAGKKEVKYALSLSGVLLSLSLIFTNLNLFGKIPQLPAFVKDPFFNPLGGVIPAGIYLIPIFFMGLFMIVSERDAVKKLFWGAASAVILMAGVLLAGSAMPGKPQEIKLPGLQVSWEVAATAITKSPVFGAGAGNYLSAFNQYRPVSYNQTDLWNARFTTANNFFLTLLTEIGLLGLFAFAVLLMGVYRAGKKSFKFEQMGLISIFVLMALLPFSPVLFILVFALLALASESEEKTITLNTVSIGENAKFAGKIPSIILGVIILSGVAVANYFGYKIVKAENTFTKSLQALNKNNAVVTYDLMVLAVKENPKVDRYHASLAQVDMAIAQSLSVKKDLTDGDKTTITQLVQQSINEAKAGVTLNPGRSGNWEVLAQIYRTIMPFAQGADNFAVQTYLQAVSLDPTNPSLRISLGGVYYALGRYDDAIDAFKLAVLAKPDLANAHYNLAIAYREKKDFDSAIREMNVVLGLVQKDSQDYTLAKNTLDELEKNKPAAKTTGTDNLTPPQPAGTSNIKPPITLPEEANPPAAQQ